MAVQDEYKVVEATGATPTYAPNYDDPRLVQVGNEEKQALTEMEQAYGGAIAGVDKHYQDLQNAIQESADKQSQLQQERTDFTIEQIEQQKDKANKDYLKEQSGAYVDWRKQSNQYGTEAEKMASAGLTGTGFSESSQVSMYNTYQNRVATAREAYQYAVLDYNNAIKDARLQNDAVLAEIANNALQKRLELALEGFQYKNQLIIEQANKKLEIDQMYWSRYTDILDQINTENALREDARQFDENIAFQTEQNQLDRDFQASQSQLDRDFTASQNQLDRDHKEKILAIENQYNLERDRINNEFTAKQNQLDRQHDFDLLNAKTEKEKELINEQYKIDKKKLADETAEKIKLIDAQKAADKEVAAYTASLSKSSSGSTKKSSSSGSGTKTITSLGRTTSSKFTGTTYSEASAYLKKNGLKNNLMTFDEWSRRKTSYQMNGQGSREVVYFNDYASYIQWYVNDAAANK